ncbi:hypothetical protein C6401_01775 [Arthrobacter woluwensis]|uniref:hypothetical protein n=1 Tax=Arthrobacter woluwensis TaxID=156980 RepID=UPI000D13DE7A|nr:hypothetical protein [Arthrobacter woluwensis]PSS45954.1 hypothetical protein C6401_01775 [Arthrobacter woluwensis]
MYQQFVQLANDPSPSPLPGLKPGLTQDMVTPGLLGFLATAFIVIIMAFLIVDMVRRIRRVRYRGEVAEAAEQEAVEADGAQPEHGASTGTDDGENGPRESR